MNKRIIAFTIYVGVALGATAQEKLVTDPQELVTLREEHVRAMQRQSIPLLTAYVRKLEAQKTNFTRQGNLDGALATDRELKEITKQLQLANAIASGSVATMKLSIVSVIYQDAKTNRSADVTKGVRKFFESGGTKLRLHKDEAPFGGVDPAPGVEKSTVITYFINGQRKEKTFKEGHRLDFKEDLN